MEIERAVGERVTCPRHRNVETYLRCGRCGVPICPKCLVHTPVGARCPTCARPTPIRGARRRLLRAYVQGGAAGLGVGMAGGAILLVAPLGAFFFIPFLLLGLLVGEAVSATTGRRRAAGLAVLAFACTVAGPVLGGALLALLLPPGPSAARLAAGLLQAVQILGPFGFFLLAVAGVIATTRVSNR